VFHVRYERNFYVSFTRNLVFKLCLPDCRLEVNTHPESLATGHLATGFLGFLVFKQMLRWSPSAKLLLRASHADFQN
jgi:hypothetical protein